MSRLQVGQDGRSKASPGLDVYGLVRDGRNSLHSKSSTRDIAAASRFPIDRANGMFLLCSFVNRPGLSPDNKYTRTPEKPAYLLFFWATVVLRSGVPGVPFGLPL
jgi:hypothetical protein